MSIWGVRGGHISDETASHNDDDHCVVDSSVDLCQADAVVNLQSYALHNAKTSSAHPQNCCFTLCAVDLTISQPHKKTRKTSPPFLAHVEQFTLFDFKLTVSFID